MTTRSLPHELDEYAVPLDEHAPFGRLVERATEVEKSTRHFIQANPGVALVGALAIGFGIGRLVLR